MDRRNYVVRFRHQEAVEQMATLDRVGFRAANTISVPPPGANGTTILTIRSGKNVIYAAELLNWHVQKLILKP